ncbi:MAG: glycosyltransferase [Candidatus Omnitrophica bacterium]|nr:glycosyltransferase [Candidatus Omnitrophota bacterium]
MFSVIIPTYNRLAFLRKAVDSVFLQTFSDFELLVVDDGSTDDTAAYIAGIHDARLRYLAGAQQGVSASRNRGIAAARGRIICFLDSDDWYAPEKLARTAEYLRRDELISVVHTDEIWYRGGTLLPQKKIHRKPDGDVFFQALRICCISMSTAAIRRHVFTQAGLFDESLPACEDYDFWLRVTCRFPVKLIPEPLTLKEGGHADQLSRRFPALDRFRIQSIARLLDSQILTAEQWHAAAAELERKCAIYIAGARKRNKTTEALRCEELCQKYRNTPAPAGLAETRA